MFSIRSVLSYYDVELLQNSHDMSVEAMKNVYELYK